MRGSGRKVNRTTKREKPKAPAPTLMECVTPSAEQLLMSNDEDEPKDDYVADMTTSTTDVNALPQKLQDPRLTWASIILEQGALYVMKNFRKVLRYRPSNFSTTAFNANQAKNRYADIQCMDSTRVILRDHTCDYIHANWLITPKGTTFICTQAPMANTISDFWHMILQEDCRTIIMLCCLEEDKKEKCVKYYPSDSSSPFTVDNIVVKLLKQDWSEELDLMTSVWNVKYREREFELRHIHYKKWPDHSAPKVTLPTLELHKVIKKCPDGHPIVIHCSAGIGRTCTLIGVEMLLEQLRTLNHRSGIRIIKNMRRSRLGAVQKAIQFLFMHYAVLDYLCQEGVLDSDDERMVAFRDVFNQLLDRANTLRLEKLKKTAEQKEDPKIQEKEGIEAIDKKPQPDIIKEEAQKFLPVKGV